VGRVIVSMFISLDGVMQSPGGEEGLGDRSGWSIPFFSEDMGGRVFEILKQADALLLGRVTYEHFAKAWPALTDDESGFADRMNSLQKYVVTSTLDQLEWNAQPLPGDPAESVARLKDEFGPRAWAIADCARRRAPPYAPRLTSGDRLCALVSASWLIAVLMTANAAFEAREWA